MKKSRLCRFLGCTPRSHNYKLWDPDQRMVIVSPNVDFGELSAPADPDQHLRGLKDAFNIHESPFDMATSSVEPIQKIEVVDGDASEWESDTKILQPRVTEDEVVPNGPNPVVPLIPREIGCCHSEAERIADAAGPPPTHERRTSHPTIGTIV